MKITLADGKIIEVAQGTSSLDVAKSISEGLARKALVAKVNGNLVDLKSPITEDCTLQILTYEHPDTKTVYRHTTAHILAQAVKNIYPTVTLAMGPAIENGFFYDFDFKTPITMDDLGQIEIEMHKIIKADFPIDRQTVTKRTAQQKLRNFGEEYKLQHLTELPTGTKISFYKQGDFVDMCLGPHLPSTGKVKFFKLLSIAGAYWKNDSSNKMLTRIYGTCFDTKAELEQYLNSLEEAKKRDHNRLGRDLGIFMTDENVGHGLPLLMPKGAKILQILQRFVEDEEEKRGYLITKTPSMAKSDLFKVSGHWDLYREGMFVMGSEDDPTSDVLALRPMTCPFQLTIYNNGLKSYRDLPIRYSETAPLFRNENSGEMHGLIRVRQFTLSDGHVICTPEQLRQEFFGCLDLIYYLLKSIGLFEDVTFRFSKWDPNKKGKYINDPEAWQTTESLMKSILDELNLTYYEAVGEAAFYGPKLDVQIKNVWGKEDTIITLQIDFALASRFKMSYIAEDGTKKTPIILHRSAIGCYERTLALLIEKYSGALPLWMSPEQVRVLALTDRTSEHVKSIEAALKEQGIRAKSDLRNEKIGYKIREAQTEKIPYMLIIGDKEKENNLVSVRSRKEGDLGTMSFEDFLSKVLHENNNKICN